MNRAGPTPVPVLTPAKLAMIVILAIVLVIVLIVQFSGGESSSLAIKKRIPRNASGVAPETAGTSSAPALAVRLHWPEIHRDEVTAYNPFLVPDLLQPRSASSPASSSASQSIQIAQSLQSTSTQTTGPGTGQHFPKADDEQARIRAKERKSRLERIRATATNLQKQGVALVVSTSTGAVARIGEQEVRVGDVINGVLRIVEINSHGIVVEEASEDTPDVGAERN